MHTVYLTEHNLRVLLNKLKRPDSARTIIKYDTLHPRFPITAPTTLIAVKDEEYYTDRPPGPMYSEDVSELPKKLPGPPDRMHIYDANNNYIETRPYPIDREEQNND